MSDCKLCDRRLYCESGLMGMLEHKWLELKTRCGKTVRLYIKEEKK